MRSSKKSQIQEELNRKSNLPTRTPGTLDPQEVQNTIIRLVSKCDKLEVEIDRLQQLMSVKDAILDTFLKEKWRDGKLEMRDDLMDSDEADEKKTETQSDDE